MPIYEYQCQACQHELEALQKMSAEPLRDCPDCGEPGLKKKISAAAFRLKGGGWYETDFKTGDKKNIAEGAGGTAAKSDSSSKDSSTSKSDKGSTAATPAAG